MKPKLSIYSQPNYLIFRTAIAREQKQFIKIAFAVHLSAVISAERYRSDSGALKSAVFNFVFLIMLKNKIEQSAKIKLLLNKIILPEVFLLTVGSGKTLPFENRPIKKVHPCTFFISEFCIRKTLKAKTAAVHGGGWYTSSSFYVAT